MRRILIAAVTTVLAGAATTASAQSVELFGVDSTISVDYFAGQNTVDRPNIVVDITVNARLGKGWTAYARPWFRQPRTPTWDKQIYQAALQHQRTGTVATRIDLGYIASPIGLGMMDTRPGINPTIMPHLSYLIPMPPFDAGAPVVLPIASTYPLGAQLTASTTMWDVRAAVLATAPNRIYVINALTNPPVHPFLVVGGGVTPRTGLRFGVSMGTGVYVGGNEFARPSTDRSLRMVSIEGEYAFAGTKISGEVTQDALESALQTETAREWFVQGAQTLTPRWFVAGRQEGTSAPPLRTGTVPGRRTIMHVTELTVGYRLSREFTLRGSFAGRKAFQRAAWDQQGGMSVVWDHRWW